MYDPFVRACNYALDEFWGSEIEGLPELTKHMRIVFACSHNRSVGTQDSARESQVKPDIVLLPWRVFSESEKVPYSASYGEDICADKPDVDLVWSRVRSTVEMKFMGPRKRKDWKRFDMEFEALAESEPYASLEDTDDQQDGYICEKLPENNCECTPSGAFLSLILFGRSYQKIGQTRCEEGAHHSRNNTNVVGQQAQDLSAVTQRR